MKKLLLLLTLITAPLFASEYVLYKDVQKDGKTVMAPLDKKEHAAAYAVLMKYQFPMSLCHDLEKELDAKELAALDADEEKFLQSKMPAGVKVAFVPKVVYEILALNSILKTELMIMPYLLYLQICQHLKLSWNQKTYKKSMAKLNSNLECIAIHNKINQYIINLLIQYNYPINYLVIAHHVKLLLENVKLVANKTVDTKNNWIDWEPFFATIIDQESTAHKQGACFLYRGTNALSHDTIDSTHGKRNGLAHSISYGMSIFSGYTQDNSIKIASACPYTHICDDNTGYLLRLSKKEYRVRGSSYHLFAIPPLSTLLSFTLIGEDYHPRTKVIKHPCSGRSFASELPNEYLQANTKLYNQAAFEQAFQKYLAQNAYFIKGIRPKPAIQPASLIKSKL